MSFEMNARLLDIDPKDMTAELFATFMLLHEFGHAHDFQTHFAASEDMQDLSEDQLALAWRTEYTQQKDELPIPGMAPAELVSFFAHKPLRVFLEEEPGVKARLLAQNLLTEEQIMEAQDRAYRNMPAESYADRFAATFIKKHMPTILSDIEKTEKQP